MPTCPHGHRTDSTRWCAVCAAPSAGAGAGPRPGAEYPPPAAPVRLTRPPTPRPPLPPSYDASLPQPPQPPPPAGALPAQGGPAGTPDAPEWPAAVDWDGDFLLPPPIGMHPPTPEAGSEPPTAGTWTAVVAADPEYHAALLSRSDPAAGSLSLPAGCPEIRVPLLGDQVAIGRRRQSTGEVPDIDLSRPPQDPGVSHRHALLVRRPDGGWSVIDQGSTNGTTVNGGSEPITPHEPVDLRDGDRVHLGAWTTITLHRD